MGSAPAPNAEQVEAQIGLRRAGQLRGPDADFIGDRQINGVGFWIVREFSADGHAVNGPADRFFYFSFMRTFHYASGAEGWMGNAMWTAAATR